MATVDLIVMELLAKATTLDAHDPDEDDVVLRVHLDRTDVPWNLAPHVPAENVTFELSGWRNGTHARVVKQEQLVACRNAHAVGERILSSLPHK